MDIVIREVLPEDAYEYISCHISCWQSAYRGIIPDDYLNRMKTEQEQRTERMKKTLSDPDNLDVFYCATYEERIIGRLILRKSHDEDKPNAGEVVAIYLLKDYWNKGYGRKMMNFAVETLKCDGYDEILLWVLEENTRARNFYEKCGFVFDGTKKEINVGAPLIEIRYVLNLR